MVIKLSAFRCLFTDRLGLVTSAAVLLNLLSGLNVARAAENLARGSGVVIGSHGEILTNVHVIRECTQITVRPSSGDRFAARLIASDDKNDLAVVSGSASISSVAAFRDLTPVRAGETVVAMGYPLSGLLATTANLSPARLDEVFAHEPWQTVSTELRGNLQVWRTALIRRFETPQENRLPAVAKSVIFVGRFLLCA